MTELECETTTKGLTPVAAPAPQPQEVPCLTVLYHPQIERVGEVAVLSGLKVHRTVEIHRRDPGFQPPGQRRERGLESPFLSRRPLRLSAVAADGVRLERGASRTRVVADGEPVSQEREFTAEELQRGVVLELAQRIVLLLHRRLPPSPTASPDSEALNLIGESPAMVELRRQIRQVGPLATTVLLRGETGTGKELVAQALHRAGDRRQRPFIAVNLAAIPHTLAASELFGALPGSYTGAIRRQEGFFRRAHRGTLFLEEVGEAPPEVQALLLRALESGEIQSVGSAAEEKVDVRVIAATDLDLEEAVRHQDFREPLLHRLAAYELRLPPLRQRREDFGRLLVAFLRGTLTELGEEHRLQPGEDGEPWIPAPLVARLARFAWPGNVRQLKNTVHQLVVANLGNSTVRITPTLEQLLADLPTPASQPPAPPHRRPRDLSGQQIQSTLRRHRWNLKLTAEALGISRSALYKYIDRSTELRTAVDLSPGEVAQAYEACDGRLEAMVDHLQVSAAALRRRLRELDLPTPQEAGESGR